MSTWAEHQSYLQFLIFRLEQKVFLSFHLSRVSAGMNVSIASDMLTVFSNQISQKQKWTERSRFIAAVSRSCLCLRFTDIPAETCEYKGSSLGLLYVSINCVNSSLMTAVVEEFPVYNSDYCDPFLTKLQESSGAPETLENTLNGKCCLFDQNIGLINMWLINYRPWN